MDHPFPKRTPSQQTGSMGARTVELIIRKELNWEFRSTPQESDFGIDGYIDIVTSEGYVTGKSLAVQIKSGKSYFQETTVDGWRYTGDLKHVNYYIHFTSPVLLILADPHEGKAWWRLFEPYETDKIGNAWAISIPSENVLSGAAKTQLEIIAGPATNYLPHLEEIWLLRERIKTNDILFIQVSRFEVESGNTRPFEKALERLSSSASALLDAKGKVDFVFDGYNTDVREIYEIPEVAAWVHDMIERVDALPYLLSLRDDAQGFSTIINILGGAKLVRKEDDLSYVQFTTPECVPGFIFEQWAKLNKITDIHGLPEEINKELTFRLRDRAQFQIPR